MSNPQPGGTTGIIMTGRICQILKMHDRPTATTMVATNIRTIQQNVAAMLPHARPCPAYVSKSLSLTAMKEENCMRFRRRQCSRRCSGLRSIVRTAKSPRRVHDPPR